MTRSMTSEMQTGIAAAIVRPVFFYEAEFGVDIFRFWSHFGNITWNTFVWTGSGNLLSFSQVEETTQLKSGGVTVTLSGIDRAFCELVRDGLTTGKLAKIYLGLLEDTGILINSPRIVFRGLLDTAEINYSDPMKPVINLQYETALIDLEKPRNWRWTNAHQLFRFPGDTGLRHVEDLIDKPLKWFNQ